jgi:hypothetical protein
MIAIEVPEYRYLRPIEMRSLALDLPRGNAHRGTPYGEKNGPAIGAIGAFSAIAAGKVTIGVLGGLMIAGGVLGLVGTLTGNKTLMAIGSIAGLAGGFITPEGAFNNPFTSGFANSSASAGLNNVFGGLKKAFNIGPSAGEGVVDSVVSGAKSGTDAVANAGGLTVNGATQIAGGGASAVDAAKNVAGSNMGLLSTLNSSKELMGLVSGAAQGVQAQPLINARIDNLDANTDATKYQTALEQQRMANKQVQNTGNIAQANTGAQIYNTDGAAATQGKFAVVVGNEVKYVTQAEYDQLRAAKAAQTPPSGGLINPGATA